MTPSAKQQTANNPSMQIRGAATHNLKRIDIDLPRGELIVFTGVSGSGKSSLAFDTLFAESQRQYLQSLSTYTRQFLDQMERPKLDSVRGLQPCLSIDQSQGVHSPRSTVGTITEVYDYLRLLMARVAIPSCYQCQQPILRQSSEAIVEAILKAPEGTKLTIMAPMVLDRKGAHADALSKIEKAGLLKVRIDGQLYELDEIPKLAVRKEHTIEAVVDRIIVRQESRDRVEKATLDGLRLTSGLIRTLSDQGEHLYSTRFACIKCGISLPEIEPRTFSFNSAYGACSKCEGYGTLGESNKTCPACQGTRLKPESLAIHLAGLSVAQITAMSIQKLRAWLSQLELDQERLRIAQPILQEILPRLNYLDQVGLGYLSLDRPGQTLSGGELQRVRLATSVGTGLTGVCYVLDEPSIGLHARDTQRLIAILESLKAKGNSIVVVEHDESMMRAASMVVDMGPGAGTQGGQVVAQGRLDQILACPDSLTGKYLREDYTMHRTTRRSVDKKHPMLRIEGVTKNNLKELDIEFPLGRLIAISGVSGSGKSTLIHDTLAPALSSWLVDSKRSGEHWKNIQGADKLERLIEIDQSPIGRTPRSTPATYCGLWDAIRKVFAACRDSKIRGYQANRFSFNSGEGRCETCAGAGRVKLEMSFLEQVDVPCSDCSGRRFNRSTLAVKYRDRSIADVLEMTIDQATDFFESFTDLQNSLRCLQSVGLGYLTLGQRSTTLSGGEAQRIKLATELQKRSNGSTVYILDEPTTGLHLADIERVVHLLMGLVDKGNTVIVVEHQLDLISCCDWIIDLGPEGGALGGQIVGMGTPEEISKLQTPTGQALSQFYNGRRPLNS
jgi:excinuclease ABC subunit A